MCYRFGSLLRILKGQVSKCKEDQDIDIVGIKVPTSDPEHL